MGVLVGVLTLTGIAIGGFFLNKKVKQEEIEQLQRLQELD